MDTMGADGEPGRQPSRAELSRQEGTRPRATSLHRAWGLLLALGWRCQSQTQGPDTDPACLILDRCLRTKGATH